MKTTIKLFALIVLVAFGITTSLKAQDRPMFVAMTTAHWNMDYKDFSMDEWKAVEKEYFDKVTSKNEFIMGTRVLMHYFTADNSEIVFVTTYRSWEDIEKAQERDGELAKEAWPNEKAREEFFKKQNAYYSHMHSDEIYSTREGAKPMSEKNTEPVVFYMRKMHRSFPEDGTSEEISALRKEYNENVIYKNKYILAYYPDRHAWGSDGRDIIEVFAVKSLCDLQASFEENQKLVEEHWPDEAKRKEFFTKLNKYTTGWHGDYIYRDVPELTK